MLALIKTDKKEYYTPVLVLYSNGWKSKVLVLDSNHNNVILQEYWVKKGSKMIRSVYMIDSSKDNWVSKGKYNGFIEILEEPRIFKEIKKGRVPEEINKIARTELQKMQVNEWMPIKNEKDVESFNDLSFGLHDALVVDIDIQDDFTLVHYDTTWSCQILMKFYGVEKSNLVETGPNYSNAYFDFVENKVIFKADLCWEDENTKSPELICERVEYKLLKTKNNY